MNWYLSELQARKYYVLEVDASQDRVGLLLTILTIIWFHQFTVLRIECSDTGPGRVKDKFQLTDNLNEGVEHMQQLLAFLAASCPSINHVSLPYLTTYDFPPTNQLKLLVSSFPHITSLTIKMYDTSKGLEELAKLHKLKQLHLCFLNNRESQRKLRTVFSSLGELRKVTIGAASFDPSTLGEFFGKQFPYK